MEFRNKKIIISASIVSALLIFVSVAFAALASNLNISFGNVTQNNLTWNVGFKGSSVTPEQSGSSTTGLACGSATVTPSDVTISDSTLSKPGDKCTYPLTIQNKGDLSANLSNIAATEPSGYNCAITNGSTMVCGNITYKLTTTPGAVLSTGITINKQEEYNIELVMSYTGESTNETATTQNGAKFTLTYTQAENRTAEASSGVSKIKEKVCKRATTLHTENCAVTINAGCYAAGYRIDGSKETTTITYGSLGTSGTLASGDAFDCDVNGDGTYDSETERFYYVSGLDGDEQSDYATLIYYTNVSAGVPNNIATYAYNSNNYSYLGPITAYEQLPTTEQWSNVNLSTQTRQLFNESNTTQVYDTEDDWDNFDMETGNPGKIINNTYDLPLFTYVNKAARLLSHKEINSGCNGTVGNMMSRALDSCEYLMEHTFYSAGDSNVNSSVWWIESPVLYDSSKAWFISGVDVNVSDYNTKSNFGIRPAIEVLKTDIDY